MSWKRIKILMWKQFLQIFRDKSMLPMLLLMPVIQLVAFGYIAGGDVRNVPLAVVDNDHSAISQQVVTAFTQSGYYTLVNAARNESDMQAALDSGKAQAAVIIPAGLENSVRAKRPEKLEVIVDGSDSRVSGVAAGYAAGIIADLSAKLYPMGAAKAGGVDAQVRVLYNPTMRAVNTMVPSLLAFILLVSTSNVMSQAIVKEREQGTLEQLFVTPISRTDYLLGKLLPFVLIGTVQILIIFTVGILWFRVPFHGSLAVLAVGLMLFMLSTLGLGMITSLTAKTRQEAQQASMFLQLPNMMLSGFMFPIEAFPKWLYLVTYLVPLRYILVILRSNFLKGSTFSELAFEFVAMAFFAIGLFLFGLSRFQKRIAD